MTALTIHDYATVNSVAGSAYAADSLHRLRKDLKSSTAMPDFSTLFENLENRGEISHEDSIFGPAAYFADLMRLVKHQSGLGEDDPKHLFTRRADLLNIPLDAEHTTKEEPYLEVVNGILVDLVNRVETRDTNDKKTAIIDLAKAHFPARLPYVAPVDAIAQCFEQMKSSLSEVTADYSSVDSDSAKAGFELWGEEAQRITKPNPSLESLGKRFGVLPEAIDTIHLMDHDSDMGFTATEPNTVYVLIDSDAAKTELVWSTNGMIVGSSAYLEYPRPEDPEYDSARRRLVRTFDNISRDGDKRISVPSIGARERDILTCVWQDPIMVDDLRAVDRIAAQMQIEPGEIIDAIYQGRRDRKFSPNSKDPDLFINKMLTQAILEQVDNALAGDKFHIGEAEGQLGVYRLTKSPNVIGTGKTFAVTLLDEDKDMSGDTKTCMRIAYDCLDRFIRLARRLNWSFADLDWALAHVADLRIDDFALKRLAQVKAMQERFSLPLVDLVGMWGPIQHNSAGKDTSDLFTRLFGFDWKECSKTAWNTRPENLITDTSSPAWLRAALHIDESDLGLVTEFLSSYDMISATKVTINDTEMDAYKMSYSAICAFYRVVMACRAMDRPMAEYVAIRSKAHYSNDSLSELNYALGYSDWMKSAGIDLKTWLPMISFHETTIDKHSAWKGIAGNLRSALSPAELALEPTPEQIRIANGESDARQALQASVDDVIRRQLAHQLDIDLDLLKAVEILFDPSESLYDFRNDLRRASIAQEGDDRIYSFEHGKILSKYAQFAKVVTTLEIPLDMIPFIVEAPDYLGTHVEDSFGWFSPASVRALHLSVGLMTPFDEHWRNLLNWGRKHFVTGEKATLAKEEGPNFSDVSYWLAKKFDCPEIWLKQPLTDAQSYENENWDKAQQYGVRATFASIKRKIDLAKKIGVAPHFLDQISTAITDFNNTASESDTEKHWRKLDQLADELRDVWRGATPKKRWATAHAPVAGKLAEGLRDALATRLIWRLSQPGIDEKWLPFGPPSTFENLSDFLLVDVEMSGVATISPIKLGLNTLQRYIQRCHMGLEYPARLPIGDKEWVWRSHYRLWEANRKVFLYPENYLDPNLRRRKTPLYEELQQDLMQGEITEDTVTQAYLNYFERLEKLADLEITGTAYEQITVPNDPSGKNTIFMVGRTRTDPTEFYLRSVIYDTIGFMGNPEPTEWKPWEKIPLQIHAASVGCAYMNHRLYIFWTEQKTTKTRNGENEKIIQTHATVKYSWQKVNGSWMHPQDFKPLAEVLIGDAILKGENHLSQMQFTDRQGDFPPGKPKRPLFLIVSPGPEPHLPISHASFSRMPPLPSNYMPLPRDFEEIKNRSGVDSHYTLAKSRYQNSNAPDADWEDMGNGLNTNGYVTHILTSSDGRGMFAGVREQGVYFSENGGDSWKLTTKTDFNISSPSVLANGYWPGTVLTCFNKSNGHAQMHRTRDNGKTWTPVGPDQVSITSIVMFPDGKTLFAIGKNKAGSPVDVYLLSQDDGMHWHASTKPDGDTNPVTATLGPWDRQMFVSGEYYYRNLPAGKWEKIDDNLKSVYVRHPTRMAYGWMGISADSKYYMSNRTGPPWHWQKYFSHPDGRDIYAIERASDGTVFLGTGKGLFQSGNNGGSFEKVDNLRVKGSSDVTVTSIAVGADRTSLYVGCNKNGDDSSHTIKRLTRRKNWVPLNVRDPFGGAPFPSLYAVNETQEDHFSALATKAVPALTEKLLSGGLEALLSLNTQSEKIDCNGSGYAVPIDQSPASAYAMYYREVFFHIPALIADTLNANQKFEDAQKWYHHIFKPVNAYPSKPDEHSYWHYKPFTEHAPERLKVNLAKYPQEFALYAQDPFDPHAIADLRPGAYEKAIVMKYIDNLLDWGDSLFRQNSWESTVQATILYKMAQDLLGSRPEKPKTIVQERKVLDFAALMTTETGTHDVRDTFHLADMAYFQVPRNDNFAGYWDRADDRLFKIRHSLDIEGIARHLSLFQPEIDPRAIIAALAGGESLADFASHMGNTAPHMRFHTALAMAKDVTRNLIGLGQSLLAALEKKDAAHISMVQATQRRAIFELMGRMKSKQVDEAASHLDALNASLQAAKERQTYYTHLLNEGFRPGETVNIALSVASGILHAESAVLNAVSMPVYLIPEIFGLADGGSNPGSALQAGAAAAESGAAVASQAGQLAVIMAENQRRRGDWQLQKTLAEGDIEQLSAEIAAAKVRADILQLEIDLHDKNEAQSEEITLLMQDRYTNEELYGWMIRKISGVYFQSYKMAFDLAKEAEAAYRFERNVADSPILHPTWDSLHKGLLAGETLMLGLNHLERAWVEAGENRAQIVKTISMKVPGNDFRKRFKKGLFTFNLTEEDFNADFPGHYCRKIESIAITIPSITGPYTDLHATLTQTTNRLIPTPDLDAVQTLSASADLTEGGVISGKVAQQVILSQLVRDTGVYEPLGAGPHYRPFEGTGAVSSWELQFNAERDAAILDSITDVVVHLRYSAKIGDSGFQEQVRNL